MRGDAEAPPLDQERFGGPGRGCLSAGRVSARRHACGDPVKGCHLAVKKIVGLERSARDDLDQDVVGARAVASGPRVHPTGPNWLTIEVRCLS